MCRVLIFEKVRLCKRIHGDKRAEMLGTGSALHSVWPEPRQSRAPRQVSAEDPLRARLPGRGWSSSVLDADLKCG